MPGGKEMFWKKKLLSLPVPLKLQRNGPKKGKWISFRFLTESDLPQIAHLHESTVNLLKPEQDGFLLPKDVRVLGKFLAEPLLALPKSARGITIGCFDEQDLCAKIMISLPRTRDELLSMKLPGGLSLDQTAELAAICVKEEYREQGIQRALFKIGTDIARKFGRTPIAEYHWKNSQSWRNGLLCGIAITCYGDENGIPILIGRGLSPAFVGTSNPIKTIRVRGWPAIAENLDRGHICVAGDWMPSPGPEGELCMEMAVRDASQ